MVSELKSRLASGGGNGHSAAPDHNSERVSMLEKKLFAVQEELTDLHRRRSENAQQIIDQVRVSLICYYFNASLNSPFSW